MAAKCPVFPISQSSYQPGDYDFDPQIQYLKVLEEAREHRPGLPLSESHVQTNSPNKNQKQQSRQGEDAERVTKKGSSKRRWWNWRSIFFAKTNRLEPQMSLSSSHPTKVATLGGYSPAVRAYSGPIYGSAELPPFQKEPPGDSRPQGRERRGWGGVQRHDLNLKDLNLAHHNRRCSTSTPIYLVT